MRAIKRHMQVVKHDPDNGTYGDCFRTCVASLLGLDSPTDVPHWFENGGDMKETMPLVDEWLLREHSMRWLAVPWDGEDTPVERFLYLLKHHFGDAVVIVVGASATGCNHTMLSANGEIIHDPCPGSPGLLGPTSEGYYWSEFFVPAVSY